MTEPREDALRGSETLRDTFEKISRGEITATTQEKMQAAICLAYLNMEISERETMVLRNIVNRTVPN